MSIGKLNKSISSLIILSKRIGVFASLLLNLDRLCDCSLQQSMSELMYSSLGALFLRDWQLLLFVIGSPEQPYKKPDCAGSTYGYPGMQFQLGQGLCQGARLVSEATGTFQTSHSPARYHEVNSVNFMERRKIMRLIPAGIPDPKIVLK